MNEFPEREWTQTLPPEKYIGSFFIVHTKEHDLTTIGILTDTYYHTLVFPGGSYDDYYIPSKCDWWFGPIELPDLPPEAK